MAESEAKLKSFLMRVKEESETPGWKLNTQKTKIMASDPITSWQMNMEKVEGVLDFYSLRLQNHWGWWLKPWNGKISVPWKVSVTFDQPRHRIKKQRHPFANKHPSSKSYGFSISYIQMCELDHKEGWAPKNWCFQTVVLDCKIKPVNPKGINPEYSLDRLMLKLQIFGH